MKDKSIESSSKLEPDVYGNIGYVHEVIDLDLPEGKNILWKTVNHKQRSIGIRMRPIKQGEMLV